MTPLVRAIFHAGALKVVGIGLTFLFFLLCARELSDFEYGVFAAIFSAATMFGFFALGGQHLTLLRFWPARDETVSREAADQLVWRALTKVAILVVCSGLLLLGAAALATANGLQLVVLSNALALVAMTSAFALNQFAQAALRARGEVLLALGGYDVVWRLLAIGGLYALILTSGEAVIFMCAVTLLGVSIFQFTWVWRAMAWNPPSLWQPTDPIETRQREAQATRWFWLNTSVGPITQHAGTLVVSIAVGPVEAGAYFAADKLAKLLTIALIAVNQIIGPLLSRNFAANRMAAVQRLVFVGTLLASSAALAAAIIFAVFGEYALSLFSDSYREAFAILMILVVGQAISSACGPCSILMKMTNLEKENTTIGLGIGLAALPLLMLSGMLYGAVGVAVCSASLLGLANILAVFVTWRKSNFLPWKRNL